MKILLQNNFVEEENLGSKLIFLGGPIKSAPEWHIEAIDFFRKLDEDLTLIIPLKPNEVGEGFEKSLLEGDKNYFWDGAREWEKYYLNLASRKGVIMFWLPKEEHHNCDKVYASTTRFELGQLLGEVKYNKNIKFSLGVEEGFPDFNVIKYDFNKDLPDLKIFSSLKDACDNAYNLLLE